MTKFKKGDKVRENRVGSEVEIVLSVIENMLITDRGMLHVTKAVKA